MSFPFDVFLGLPFLLYAETHYRFRYFFSLLKKSEPELIADAPHRIEQNQPLPILILAKDSHRYPCVLRQVEVDLQRQGKSLVKEALLDHPVKLREPLWWKIWKVRNPGIEGWIDCDVTMTIERQGSTKLYHNDNHITSSRKPLRVFLSKDPLPCFPGLYLGDAHTHSDYTDDPVEFGSPLMASKELSKAMGLSFFCVTDHSYDLDDRIDNYLLNDPSLPKWKDFKNKVQSINKSDNRFVVIPGEEVSCRNGKGENVHLLLYGNEVFFHGSGDGAEKWLRTRSEHSLDEVIQQKETSAAAFASHAKEQVPFLQKLLLKRGHWHTPDLTHDGLDGLQFANGNVNDGFLAGYNEWIRLLLKGKQLLTIAGNDSHGNFNRFRQVGFPFFKVVEKDTQIFGKMRTAVFLEKRLSEKSILAALKRGSFIITDGPILNLRKKGQRSLTSIGQEYRDKSLTFRVSALTTKEFGTIERLKVLMGKIGSHAEEQILSESSQGLQYENNVSITATEPGYVRAEAFTSRENSSDGQFHFCYTNPVWLHPKGSSL